MILYLELIIESPCASEYARLPDLEMRVMIAFLVLSQYHKLYHNVQCPEHIRKTRRGPLAVGPDGSKVLSLDFTSYLYTTCACPDWISLALCRTLTRALTPYLTDVLPRARQLAGA